MDNETPFLSIDADIEAMTIDQLKSEIIKLRAGIRIHRDSSMHSLCWFHPEMWDLLPEKLRPQPEVPSREEFLRCCGEYRDSLGK